VTPRRLAILASLAAFVLHVPFVVRYDLHFQPDFAILMLMSHAIAFEGSRPVFFWGQDYLGSYGCYLTALPFHLLGPSVPLAGAVSLGIWACGVGLATVLAERLLGRRAAWWTAAAAVVASPYANHYVTQPYSSYETAPVLSILAIGGFAWATRLVVAPLDRRTAGGWILLGVLLGFGWWTTRLFLPSLVAVLIAAVLVTRARDVQLRRTAAAAALFVVGAGLGDSPELLYQLGDPPQPQQTRSFGIAPLATVPQNLREAIASFPAYLNGDPRARLPEGVAFSRAMSEDRDPHEGAPPASVVASAFDILVRIALLGILMAAVVSAVRAYRMENAPVLALCLVPFTTLVAIGLSAETAGEYFIARRYWFGLLLVLPALFANAVVLSDRIRLASIRHGVRAVAVALLVNSAISQAGMLGLPDELADYRVLARDLISNGEQTVCMQSYTAWVVAALAGGQLDPIAAWYNRRPEILERVAQRDRVAFVVPADSDFPPHVRVRRSRFFPAEDGPRSVGPWRWRRYVRVRD
jgi:hypothetical protein